MNVPAQNIDMNCRLPSAIHRLNCLLLIMTWMAPVSIIPKSDGTRGKTIWRSTLHIWPIPCSIFSSGRHMRSIHQHHPCQCRFDSSLVMHTLNAHTRARTSSLSQCSQTQTTDHSTPPHSTATAGIFNQRYCLCGDRNYGEESTSTEIRGSKEKRGYSMRYPARSRRGERINCDGIQADTTIHNTPRFYIWFRICLDSPFNSNEEDECKKKILMAQIK